MTRVKRSPEQGAVSKKTLIVIVGIVLLTIIGFALLPSLNNDQNSVPRQVADEFVTELVNVDAGSTYDMLTESFRETITVSDWEAWVGSTFSEINIQEAFFKEDLPVGDPESTYGEGTSPVRYIYSFTVDGEKYTMALVLLNGNGAWKVAELGAIESEQR